MQITHRIRPLVICTIGVGFALSATAPTWAARLGIQSPQSFLIAAVAPLLIAVVVTRVFVRCPHCGRFPYPLANGGGTIFSADCLACDQELGGPKRSILELEARDLRRIARLLPAHQDLLVVAQYLEDAARGSPQVRREALRHIAASRSGQVPDLEGWRATLAQLLPSPADAQGLRRAAAAKAEAEALTDTRS